MGHSRAVRATFRRVLEAAREVARGLKTSGVVAVKAGARAGLEGEGRRATGASSERVLCGE